MKNLFVLTLAIVVIVFAIPAQALAAETPNCTPIYGGSGDSCIQTDPLVIDTKVQNPNSQDYVDNVPEDITFSAGSTVRFKITITNSSDASVHNLTVKDIFPQYVTYAKGMGNYDQNARTLTFTIDELAGKESKVFFIEGTVVSQENLPNGNQSNCLINQTEVSSGGKVSRDNVSFCVPSTAPQPTATPQPTRPPETKGGTTVYPPAPSKQTPKTGPEALGLLGLLPLGGLGAWLRKRA